MSARKRRLGAGVDTLLTGPAVPVDAGAEAGLMQVPLARLQPSPHQPRGRFEPEAIARLAESIRRHGLIQPVVVRRAGDRFDLVAGERRVRAAREAGLDALPAVVRELGDDEAAELTLVENLQREDLNPMEEARALRRLMEMLRLSHGQVADRVGRARPTVSNLLRLLELHAAVQRLVEDGALSMGHARLLAGAPKNRQSGLASAIVARAMSVREAERHIRAALTPRRKPPGRKPDADARRLEQRLSDQLGYPVSIRAGRGGGGAVLLHYSDLESLQALLARLGYSET